MNISLPAELKTFIDERLRVEGHGTSSEYMRELIRRDCDRVQSKEYLMDGVRSKAAGSGRRGLLRFALSANQRAARQQDGMKPVIRSSLNHVVQG